MKPWIWIDERDVRAVHDRSLVLHGAAAGLRDAGLLELALARPQPLEACGETVDHRKAMTPHFSAAKSANIFW